MFKNDRNKSVEATVKTNIAAYENITQTLKFEDDEEFKKILESLQKGYEKYFELTAERCLEDYFGDRYTDFAKKFTKEEEAAQSKRVETRKANQAKNEAEQAN